MIEAANRHFGLPSFTPVYWPAVANKLLKDGRQAS
jgi:hypothetical protein